MVRFGVRVAGAVLSIGGLVVATAVSSVAAPVADGKASQVAAVAAPSCTRAAMYNEGDWREVLMPIGAAAGSFDCLIRSGAVGSHVMALQRALVFCHGLDTGGVDGQYGTKTVAAVRTVQQQAGIPDDGIYGPQTRRALKWPWSVGPCDRMR